MADRKPDGAGDRIAEALQQTTTPDAGGTVASRDPQEDLEIEFEPEDDDTVH